MTTRFTDCPSAYPPGTHNPARRGLLKGLAASAAAPWVLPLQALAQTSTASDYKALVCVFLFGGNDGNNMVVPIDTTEFNQYQSARARLALGRETLLPITPSNGAGRRFGIHPAMPGLAQLFSSGKAAIAANVGPLLVPTTRAQYQARSVPLPAALFSHSDQQAAWQTGLADGSGRNGWGGRVMERVLAQGARNRGFAALSVTGGNIWQVGDQSLTPYKLGSSGNLGLEFFSPQGTDPLAQAVRATLAEGRGHLMQQAWLDVMQRSVDVQAVLSQALGSSTLNTAFPDTGLGRQLRLAARLISVRAALGLPRQIYFASLGGFDTHGDEQLARQADLLGELSNAATAFYNATVELGVANQVTLFTASDFGRTLASNGQGSDHGWGNHQWVLGGGVAGGRIAGTFPNLALNGPDDTDTGRWIPSTATDQLGASLGRWMGASDAQLATVFPRLAQFNGVLPLMA